MLSTEKDEWLFLAALSLFVSSTLEIVSPSAEQLCGTLGTENREISTRKSNSQRQRESKKRRETLREGVAWSALPIIITASVCTHLGKPGATVNPAVGMSVFFAL